MESLTKLAVLTSTTRTNPLAIFQKPFQRCVVQYTIFIILSTAFKGDKLDAVERMAVGGLGDCGHRLVVDLYPYLVGVYFIIQAMDQHSVEDMI